MIVTLSASLASVSSVTSTDPSIAFSIGTSATPQRLVDRHRRAIKRDHCDSLGPSGGSAFAQRLMTEGALGSRKAIRMPTAAGAQAS